MKFSKSKINEYIQLYLNDLEDYGDESVDLLTEKLTLHNFSQLLVESHQDVPSLLREAITKSGEEQRKVYENFLEYLENI
jgi:hypothetical protein